MNSRKRPGQLKHLGEYANTDRSVRGPVRAYIRQLGSSFILREVWKPLGLPRDVVHRELGRMVRAGLLERHKVPARENFHLGPGFRMVYFYTPTAAFQ